MPVGSMHDAYDRFILLFAHFPTIGVGRYEKARRMLVVD